MSTQVADAERGRGILKPALIAAAGLVAVVTAIGLNYLAPDNSAPGEKIASTSTPAAPPAPAPGADAASFESGLSPLPAFDVVRINPHGDTVIAGRAEPGVAVVLRDGGTVLGEVNADSRGEWVFVPENPLPPGSHRLLLEMRTGAEKTVGSTDEVIIVVPNPGEDVAGRPATPTTQPLVLRQPRNGGAAAVMQSPGQAAFDSGSGVAIETVDASGNDWLVLTGRAPANTRVRVSIDGQKLGDATASNQGQWHLRAQRRLDSSRHGLSVEALDASGAVVARSGAPLLLGEAASPSSPGPMSSGEGQVVVQRGENLWRIARSAYGRGTSYTVIYEANQGRIADPDLIYPGQVFALPAEGRNLTETRN